MNHRLRLARRLSALLIVGGAALIAIPVGSAFAVIDQVGPVTLTVTAMNFQVVVNGDPSTIGPITGSLTGTVDDAGNMSFPMAGISFTPLTGPIGPVEGTVSPQALSDFTGTVDPTSGVVTLTGEMQTLAAVPVLGLTACPLGPFTIHTTTTNSGGVPYSAAGAATVSDPAYSVPAVPAGIEGCAGNDSVINLALGLPGTGGVTIAMSFDPVLTGSGVVPTSTIPPPTTIPTTPTTAAPGAGGGGGSGTTAAPATTTAGTLPRTGSSSGPLAVLGVGLIGAGLALVIRRRRAPLG